jgi:hypothetical protein
MLAKEHAIPFVKIGARTIKFDEDIVVEWIRSGGTKSFDPLGERLHATGNRSGGGRTPDRTQSGV